MPTVDRERQVGVLLLRQATAPASLEDRLLREDLVSYHPVPSVNGNANSTNIVDLQSGIRCFHKPVAGVDKDLAGQYGHDPITVALNECVAWQMARRMGSPYDELVAVTVLRFHKVEEATRLMHPSIEDGWGSLCAEQPGVAVDSSPLGDPSLNDPAAFFDALIAQQDRHVAQYRWEPRSGRLGLIDHGFAFARAGNPLNASLFLAQRHKEGRSALTESEIDLLRSISDEELWGLGDILEVSQAEALAARIERMLASGKLIEPRDW